MKKKNLWWLIGFGVLIALVLIFILSRGDVPTERIIDLSNLSAPEGALIPEG
jgi:hypothetical protein